MNLQTYGPLLILVAAVVVAVVLYRFMRARARKAAAPVEPPFTAADNENLDSSHIGGPISGLSTPPRPSARGRDT